MHMWRRERVCILQRSKVNLPLWVSRSSLEGEEVGLLLYLFLIWALEGWMIRFISCPLYPGEMTLFHIEYGAGWALEPNRIFWRRYIEVVPAGYPTPDPPTHSLESIEQQVAAYRVTTDWHMKGSASVALRKLQTCTEHYSIYRNVNVSSVLFCLYRRKHLEETSIHPSMYGATAPAGPGPPSKSASTFLYLHVVSSILVFLAPVMHPSGRRPPILFLVFLLILNYGISHEELFSGIL